MMARLSVERHKKLTGMLMTLPSILALAVFVFYPIVRSVILSLYNYDLLRNTRDFLGTANYARLVSDERFWNALVNTFYYTLAYVPGLVLASLLLALALNTPFRGHKAFRSLFFLPSITSMAIIAMIWRFILDPDVGMISAWFRNLGLPVVDLLRNPDLSLSSVVGVSIWRWAGFNMVIILAGLNTIPSTYYEAAEMDGSGRFRTFFSITLPLLLPSLSFVIVTNVIASFQVFDPVYVMTKGGPLFSTETMVYYIYYQGFTLFRMGYASALAFILFMILIVFTLIQLSRFVASEKEAGL